MPGYVKEALVRFKHNLRKFTSQPNKHIKKTYGATIKYALPEDDSAPVNVAGKPFIQQMAGTFLFYARAVDHTILVALSAIYFDQATRVYHAHGNGPHTTPHYSPDGQDYRTRICTKKPSTKTNKILPHAELVASGPRGPKSIPIFPWTMKGQHK